MGHEAAGLPRSRGASWARGDRVRPADLARAFEDRAPAALLPVLALSDIVPLPPGVSAVFGVPPTMISARLALGRAGLRLPRAVGGRSLPGEDPRRVARHTAPALRRAERLLAPRLGVLVAGRLIGAACFAMAAVPTPPIPFGNAPPALAALAVAGFLSGAALPVAGGGRGRLRRGGVPRPGVGPTRVQAPARGDDPADRFGLDALASFEVVPDVVGAGAVPRGAGPPPGRIEPREPAAGAASR